MTVLTAVSPLPPELDAPVQGANIIEEKHKYNLKNVKLCTCDITTLWGSYKYEIYYVPKVESNLD